MVVGTVKWFDPNKGFGFIVNQEGVDVFVHYTSIEGDGFRCLKSGQKVCYEEIGSDKGLQGRQVKPLSVEDESIQSSNRRRVEASQVDSE